MTEVPLWSSREFPISRCVQTALSCENPKLWRTLDRVVPSSDSLLGCSAIDVSTISDEKKPIIAAFRNVADTRRSSSKRCLLDNRFGQNQRASIRVLLPTGVETTMLSSPCAQSLTKSHEAFALRRSLSAIKPQKYVRFASYLAPRGEMPSPMCNRIVPLALFAMIFSKMSTHISRDYWVGLRRAKLPQWIVRNCSRWTTRTGGLEPK